METYRLKNIIILILLLLNIFLLSLVVSRYLGQQQAERNLIDQTAALLEKNEVSIDPTLLTGTGNSVSYSYERSRDDEAAFAAALLGEVTAQNSNGSADLYSNEFGSVTFRSNGSFSLEMNTPVLYAPSEKDFVQEYCPDHYILTKTGNNSITVTPYVDGDPIYNASIHFLFQNQYLISASGYWIPPKAAASETVESITKCSAVVYLVDNCKEEGRICNAITDISTGYVLKSTASTPLLLTPAYKIDTNTYSYYISAETGHVSVSY